LASRYGYIANGIPISIGMKLKRTMNFLKKVRIKLFILMAVMGPGIITAFADNDAGGVATNSVAASQFGYSMLTVTIPIAVVLLITQEIGSRIAIASGKGLADLIREYYGIRIALIIFGLLFFVNFGVILQNVGGLKSAAELFSINIYIFLPACMLVLFLLVTNASYSKIEKLFLFLIVIYMGYFFSAILAKPDWGLVATSLVRPTAPLTFSYLYTAIAVLGTTVTAWGQFFINSYVKDKNITEDHLKYNQWEIYIGAILTNLFSLFMMVAVAATVFQHGLKIEGAADAALAIKPFAGDLASLLFGVGLLNAGFIGAAIVPLATAYAFSEFFGFEGSLDQSFSKSRLFYSLFIVQIILGVGFTLLPQVSLFKITLYADFLNGLFLPIIFYFLYKFSNDPDIMGKHTNSSIQNFLLGGAGIVITFAALLGGVGKILGW